MNAKTIILIIVAVLFLLAAIFFFVYFGRFQTISTIKKLTDYDDGFNLYSMTVQYDYSTKNIIASHFTDTQGFTDAVVRESLPLLPVKIQLPSYGCSTYRALSDEGDVLMGRNYDFKLNTSCMLVYCNPKDGYRSMAFSALDNMHADDATAGLKEKMACLTSPFTCLDGINEKGVSIAVLTLTSEPTDQNTGRDKITASLAIRLVLDYAATTQEAVDLIRQYDMYAVNGRDYHLFISDASGDSRVIEYDPETPERKFVDTPMQAITNFYALYIDKVLPNQKNGIYGLGKERYDAMMEVIEANNGVLSGEAAWSALQAAATEPNPESVTSNTQWSVIYNNTDLTADIALRRHWDDITSFSLQK